MALEVHADAREVATRAAELFVECMQTAARRNGRFSVALSGGNTPRAAYEEIARRAGGDAAWAYSHVFWGDERCVEPGDARSNERAAREALLAHVPVPEAQVHPMRCAGDAAAAAAAYEQLLRGHFGTRPRFDLILLGMGADGHTASLFPDSPLLGAGAAWVAFARRPNEEFVRLTLTLSAINQAGHVVFLVSGAGKALALRRAIAGDEDLPASLVQPEGEIDWLVDEDAARLLGAAR